MLPATRVYDFFQHHLDIRALVSNIVSNASKCCLATRVFLFSQMLPTLYLSERCYISEMPPMPFSHKGVSLKYCQSRPATKCVSVKFHQRHPVTRVYVFFLKCPQRRHAPRVGVHLKCCQCRPATNLGASLKCRQCHSTIRVHAFFIKCFQ